MKTIQFCVCNNQSSQKTEERKIPSFILPAIPKGRTCTMLGPNSDIKFSTAHLQNIRAAQLMDPVCTSILPMFKKILKLILTKSALVRKKN